MTFTYEGDPSVSDVAQVRFLVGDTTETLVSLSDAEVQFFVNRFKSGTNAKHYASAASCAEILATRYHRQANKMKAVGDLKIGYDYTKAAEGYLELADRLRNHLGPGGFVVPLQGLDSNANVPASQFSIGMHDDLASNTPDQAISNFPDF